MKVLTNSFVISQGKILLGMKKRGFGAGKYNGFGGKLSLRETVLEAAQREFQEEAGITMLDPVELGQVNYKYEGMDNELEVHVFRAETWKPDNFIETEEMTPQWFWIKDIPYDEMWADDIHWYPLLLKGCKFKASFSFAADMQTILEYSVQEL